MQKVSVYIDPSGKKKKNYEIVFPYALDVKDEIEAVIQSEEENRDENVRPDIRPLISALNRHGAEYHYKGGTMHLGYQHFHIEVDQQHDLLNLYLLIPKTQLMQSRKLSDKWTIGIISINDFASLPPPEQGEEDGLMPPPVEGGDQQSILTLMQSDIRLWTKFSIDDVNNANLKE